jgi:hypothetical protein
MEGLTEEGEVLDREDGLDDKAGELVLVLHLLEDLVKLLHGDSKVSDELGEEGIDQRLELFVNLSKDSSEVIKACASAVWEGRTGVYSILFSSSMVQIVQ